MLRKCPQCGTPISNKWLFLSPLDKAYICNGCNTVYKWNHKRKILTFVFIFAAFIPFMVASSFITESLGIHGGFGLVLYILIAVLIIVYWPNLYHSENKT
jgi:CXXC-20-CXXC protein